MSSAGLLERCAMLERGISSVGAHFWVLVAPERHVRYRYSHTHDNDAVDRLLAGYKGYLVADTAPVYDHLYETGDVIEATPR